MAKRICFKKLMTLVLNTQSRVCHQITNVRNIPKADIPIGNIQQANWDKPNSRLGKCVTLLAADV